MADKGQVIRLGGISIDVGLRLQNLNKGIDEVRKTLGKLQKEFNQTGKLLSTAITAPIIGIGTAALKAAVDHDNAFNKIKRQTGTSGDAFKELKKTFEDIFSNGDDSADEVASALSKVRTVTGATGETLKQLTNTVLDLADITGDDLNSIVDASSKAMNQWEISTQDATSKLDFLNTVSQRTGTNFSQLTNTITAFGPLLKSFGFSFEESAVLIGNLTKSGADVEKVFSGFNKLIPKLNENNIPLRAGLEAVVNEINNLGGGAKSAEIAMNAFGNKAGIALTQSIDTSAESLLKQTEAFKNSSISINQTAKDTQGFTQLLKQLQNAGEAALQPLGEVILVKLKDILPKITEDIRAFAEVIKSIDSKNLVNIVEAGAGLAIIGPILFGVGQVIKIIKDGFLSIKNGISILSQALQIILKPINIVYDALLPLFNSLSAIGLTAIKAFSAVGVGVGIFLGVVNAAGGNIRLFLQGFVELFNNAFNAVSNGLQNFASIISNNLSNAFSEIISIFDSLLKYIGIDASSIISTALTKINELFLTFKDNIISVLNDLIVGWKQFLTNFRSGIFAIGNTLGVESWKTWALEGQKAANGISDNIKTNVKPIIAETSENIKSLGVVTKNTGVSTTHFGNTIGNIGNILNPTSQKIKEATKAVQNLREQLENTKTQNLLQDLDNSFNDALKFGNQDSINDLKERIKSAVFDSTYSGLKDSIAEAAKAGKEEEQRAKQAAFEIATEVSNQKIKEISTRETEALKQAHQESVNFWRSSFENQITGVKFSLLDLAKQVGVGIAAELAAGLTSSLGDLNKILSGSPQDFGASIVKSIFGGSNGNIDLGNISFESITDSIFGKKANDSFIGPLTENGKAVDGLTDKLFEGANSASAWSSAVVASIDGLSKIGKSQEGTVSGLSQTAGAAVGAYFGGPIGAQIGAQAGKLLGDGINSIFGSKGDPERLARLELTGKLEELIDKIGGLKFFDESGNLQNVTNLKSGAIDFTKPNWSQDLFNQFGASATNAFVGVGEALQELLGISEDVGSQVGASLLQQFGGSVEGLKALVDTAGLSYEKLTELLISQGKKGEETWLEIISEIRDAQAAFQAGLTGNGLYVNAFDNLLKTAGKGQIALNQVKNIAIEAQEAGINTLEGLKNKLIESGQFSQTQIEALFHSFSENNIKNLSDVGKLSDFQLGSIVASIDAYLQDHGGKWKEASTAIQEYGANLDKLNNKEVNIKINVKTKFDENTDAAVSSGIVDSKDLTLNASSNITSKFATGGILNGPTIIRPGALAGEAGPEAILPLKRVNGQLGVTANLNSANVSGKQVILNIDARGAQRGVEQDILIAMQEVEDRAVQRAVDAIVRAL